jgi:hypothetical protein
VPAAFAEATAYPHSAISSGVSTDRAKASARRSCDASRTKICGIFEAADSQQDFFNRLAT